MFPDPDHLWIATYTGGINILNVKTGKFNYINHKNNNGLPSNNIYDFGRFDDWVFIATTNGIARYEITNG